MQEFIKANKKYWDACAPHHFSSPFYKMEQFRAGQSSLDGITLDRLGHVEGKRILHLQCHFGQDTISLARMGAEVVGVDFSGEAISRARLLAKEMGVQAQFVESNIYELWDALDGQFDDRHYLHR